MARKVPEINSTSTADIAFMLLIFFLVTTTMDVDSGLLRKLPPPAPETLEKPEDVVRERNVFVVLLNKHNQLLVEGALMEIGELREATKNFVINPNNDENLPEKRVKTIDYFGEVMISKGIVSLQNDRGTEFSKYLAVQNELVAAYRELREGLAKQKFGKAYNDLPDDKMKAINKFYPQAISEAEPRNVGG